MSSTLSFCLSMIKNALKLLEWTGSAFRPLHHKTQANSS
jgi:hypothetical protein